MYLEFLTADLAILVVNIRSHQGEAIVLENTRRLHQDTLEGMRWGGRRSQTNLSNRWCRSRLHITAERKEGRAVQSVGKG